MNIIKRAVQDLNFTIPKRILETVFTRSSFQWRGTPIDIGEIIINTVIKPRVLIDCDIVGGVEDTIPLEGITPIRVDNFNYVYNIPPDRTQNRSILTALSVSTVGSRMPYAGFANAASAMGGSAMLNAGNMLIDSNANIPINSTAKVELIGENVILIKDTQQPSPYSFVRVKLANEEELNNIHIRSYHDFSTLVGHAVRAYIYNEMILEMDYGFLAGGMEIGRFKEKIEEYADAEELYQTFLRERWMKVAFMNDEESFGRLINLMTGSR